MDNRGLIAEQKAYLDKADVQDVYLIGGADVVSNKVGRELKAYDKDGKTERIAGDNRYKTLLEVAKAFFPKKCDSAVLAYGMKFPDGLAGRLLAISMGSPLLLVEDTAYADAKAYGSSVSISKLAVLGGTDVISDATAESISAERTKPKILIGIWREKSFSGGFPAFAISRKTRIVLLVLLRDDKIKIKL